MTDKLADAFADIPEHVSRCAMGRILDQASDEARERIQAALDGEHIAHDWITLKLRNAGQPISRTSVRAHRRGECRCKTS